MTIREVFYFTAFTALVGWGLVIGKTIILPVVVAVMLTYVLVGATKAIRRLPVLGAMPVWLAYVLAVSIFGAALATISLVAVSNLRDIARAELAYEEDVLRLIGGVLSAFGLADAPTWENLRQIVIDRVDMTDLSIDLLATLASTGGYVVLISTYIVFMVIERVPLARKIEMVLPEESGRGASADIFKRINDQIVTYLSTKTLIGVIIGVLSWLLLTIMGIENAVFWAFLIGLFNYVPYVGSIVAVAVVVIYSAFAYGSLQLTLTALVTLTAAQVYVGNWLEPRIMSRTMNLSPLTVLLALVVWASLWGLPGAIIAVPMTSILLITLAAFQSTRPVAILASRDGDLF